MSDYSQTIFQSAAAIRVHLEHRISTGIILGSGLSSLAGELFADSGSLFELGYDDIECLAVPTAESHVGKLIIGEVSGKLIALCQGRSHLYEGASAQQVAAQAYLLHALGAQQFIVTNAAGSLNPEYKPGDIMLINDHINLTGHTPLIGQDESFGIMFPDMSQAYSSELLVQASAACNTLGIKDHQGIYAGMLGPSLETSAERRMLRILGADAVGMSTVMEVIAANHSGMNVLGLSAITNQALGDADQKVDTIEEVLENAAIAGQSIKKIITALLA